MNQSPIDPVAFVKATVAPMRIRTLPYVTSIVGILSETEGEHVGSAVRCILAGRRAIVTAHHVAERARAAALGAGYTTGRGQPPVPLPRAPTWVDTAGDLAAFVVDDPPEGDAVAWWPEDLVSADRDARSHDYLFVHGFPGSRSRFALGAIHHNSLPYGAMERDDDLPRDARPHEFAIDYDPNHMVRASGTSADFVGPSGLSGSGIWRIGAYQQAASAWRPESARLVGVVTRYNADKRVLLATGAERLLRLAAASSA